MKLARSLWVGLRFGTVVNSVSFIVEFLFSDPVPIATCSVVLTENCPGGECLSDDTAVLMATICPSCTSGLRGADVLPSSPPLPGLTGGLGTASLPVWMGTTPLSSLASKFD